MNASIRQILIGGALLLLAVLIFVTAAVTGSATRSSMEDLAFQEMERELALVSDWIGGVQDADSDSLVRAVTARIDHRVTLIDTSGVVLADSDVPPVRMPNVQDHADRPEVQAALDQSTGFSVRESATVGRPLLYAARTVELDGETVVLRIAASAEPVEAAVDRVRGRVLGWGALIAALAFFSVMRFSSAVADPVGSLIQRSRKWIEGELDQEGLPDSRIRELDDLSAVFARLGAELQARIGELSLERDQMQILIDSMAEGVLALTDDARILRTNEAARELLDLPPALRFAPVGSVVRQPNLRDLLESAVVQSFQSREVELGDRHLIVQSRLLVGGGAVVTLLDVTELRRLEQVRQDFVANASHELKTPLTSVRGFAETLLEDDPPEDIRHQFLASIRDNTVRLQKLVDDLLDLSRLESGGWVAVQEELPVASAVGDAWQDLASRAMEKELDFGIEGDAVVLADPRGLSEVFQNLLENSVQYTPPGGSVKVTIHSGGGDGVVAIEVTDTGIGIPSASLHRIFERFYRADPARSREAGGTGLGLAIVKHLVDAMDGRVSASSRLGRGTTIRVELPEA